MSVITEKPPIAVGGLSKWKYSIIVYIIAHFKKYCYPFALNADAQANKKALPKWEGKNKYLIKRSKTIDTLAILRLANCDISAIARPCDVRDPDVPIVI